MKSVNDDTFLLRETTLKRQGGRRRGREGERVKEGEERRGERWREERDGERGREEEKLKEGK